MRVFHALCNYGFQTLSVHALLCSSVCRLGVCCTPDNTMLLTRRYVLLGAVCVGALQALRGTVAEEHGLIPTAFIEVASLLWYTRASLQGRGWGEGCRV